MFEVYKNVYYFLPVDEDVAIPETSCMDEIVADGEVLGQILVRRIGSQDAEVVFVL